jgi:hypothetical protein
MKQYLVVLTNARVPALDARSPRVNLLTSPRSRPSSNGAS